MLSQSSSRLGGPRPAGPATEVTQAKATVPRRPRRESASEPEMRPPVAEALTSFGVSDATLYTLYGEIYRDVV